jgi:hypothetical protein
LSVLLSSNGLFLRLGLRYGLRLVRSLHLPRLRIHIWVVIWGCEQWGSPLVVRELTLLLSLTAWSYRAIVSIVTALSINCVLLISTLLLGWLLH